MEEIKKKKSNKGLVAIIIILLIALLGAIGYICYDKGVFDSLLNKGKPVEEPKQEEKLSEEEVMKLHETLITKDKEYGLYFNNKVTLESISADDFIPYVTLNYASDNNVKYEGLFAYDADTDKYVVKGTQYAKSEIDNYAKEKYNLNRELTLSKSNDSNYASLWLYNNKKKLVYDTINRAYYFVVNGNDSGTITVASKLLKFEQNGDELYVYDKFVACGNYMEGKGCSISITDITDNKYFIESSNFTGKTINIDDAKNINPDYVIDNMIEKLNTYKHTFKKASDGKYYWYSSEIVNEQNNSQNTSENTSKSHKSAYLDVLAGNRKYINENNKEVTINSFGKVNGWEINLNGSAKISKYALVDMDNDGSEELIALIEDYDGFYLILHYENGKIYGYEDGQRGITQLKTNGYYYGSCGADCGSVLRSTFNKNVRTQKTLADNNNGIYKINGKKATKKEFNKYLDKFNSYKDVTWIKY